MSDKKIDSFSGAKKEKKTISVINKKVLVNLKASVW